MFNEKYNKLVRNLAVGKRQLLETMDSAKSVYDQREESLQKLNALFVKSKLIYTDHVEVYFGTLKYVIDEYRK